MFPLHKGKRKASLCFPDKPINDYDESAVDLVLLKYVYGSFVALPISYRT